MRVHAGVHAVARHERQLAAFADELRAGGRLAVGGQAGGAQPDLVAERRLRVRVVDPGLEEARLAAQGDLDALAPRVADVLEEQADGAGRRDRKDVVDHVGAVHAHPGVEPRPRLRAHADLVITRLDRLERRVRRGAGLQPGAHRRRRRARELEERRRAEALGVGEVDAHGGHRVVVDAEAGRGAAEGVAAAGARAVWVGAAVTDRVV